MPGKKQPPPLRIQPHRSGKKPPPEKSKEEEKVPEPDDPEIGSVQGEAQTEDPAIQFQIRLVEESFTLIRGVEEDIEKLEFDEDDEVSSLLTIRASLKELQKKAQDPAKEEELREEIAELTAKETESSQKFKQTSRDLTKLKNKKVSLEKELDMKLSILNGGPQPRSEDAGSKSGREEEPIASSSKSHREEEREDDIDTLFGWSKKGDDKGQLSEEEQDVKFKFDDEKKPTTRVKSEAESLTEVLCAALQKMTASSSSSATEKLLTRQTLGRDLPVFSGRPEQWPSFFEALQKTTTACGFSEEENVERLRKCLRGEAFQTVKGMFASPNAFKVILRTLVKKYGQPKIIIRALVDEVKSSPEVKRDQPATLIQFGEKVVNLAATIKNLGEMTYLKSSILVDELADKLPHPLKKSWCRDVIRKKLDGDLEEFASWIEDEVEVAYLECPPSAKEKKKGGENPQSHSQQQKQKMAKGNKNKSEADDEDVPTAAGLFSAKNQSCLFCDKQTHPATRCIRADSMFWDEKMAKIKEANVCFVCFKGGHQARQCKVKVKCLLCEKRHHKMMCPQLNTNQREPRAKKEASQPIRRLPTELLADLVYADEEGFFEKEIDVSPKSAFHERTCRADVRLQTLVVRAEGPRGSVLVRLMFDNGSQTSYAGEEMLRKLGAPQLSQRIERLIFLNGAAETRLQKVHSLVIASLDGKFRKKIQVVARKSVVPAKIPTVPHGPWIQELRRRGVWVSDHEWVKTDMPEIQIMIGADYYGELFTGERIQNRWGLFAFKTALGWTMSGTIKGYGRGRSLGALTLSLMSVTDREKDLWELEAIGIKDPAESHKREDREAAAMEYFLSTVSRKEDGRYQVFLPKLDPLMRLPDNFGVTKKMLMPTTKKLLKVGKFDGYEAVLKTWEDRDMVEEVEFKLDKCHYIPHHPVFKPQSKTTPIRPVFNASFKMGKNPSLNDLLEKGPNLLEPIPAKLLGFRKEKYAVTADIEKAFLQIEIVPEDRDLLRFLWWEDLKSGIIRVMRHSRVLFGMNCSPFLLQAVIEKHLGNVKPEFREIAMQLLKSLYIDNAVTSLPTREAVTEFRRVSILMMKEAKMLLRQWDEGSYEEGEEETTVLGLTWNKRFDTLSCEVPAMPEPQFWTKRVVLSMLQKVYDPMGFLCPATLRAKLILQQCWKQKVSWDDELPQELRTEFQRWWQEVKDLEKVRVPRFMKIEGSEKQNLHLHVFCDASKDSYATAVFLRSSNEEKVQTTLLQAKTRVAPIKEMTIPRKELLACVIGARLTATVKKALEFEDVPTTFWSDASTALAWIRRGENWGTFVGNRVAEILKSTSPEQWSFVAGEENPADLPSRGCSPRQLANSSWWEGPEWLSRDPEQWPAKEVVPDEELVAAEKRKTAKLMAFEKTGEIKFWFKLRFFSYTKYLRTFAWMLKFIRLVKEGGHKKERAVVLTKKTKNAIFKPLKLSIEEMERAEVKLFSLIQSDCFPVDERVVEGIKVLKDESGLLRVKTKLLYRDDEKTFKMPVLLPSNHEVVNRLIREVHVKNCHAGIQATMSLLRERVWILQGRRAVRRIVSNCRQCRRYVIKHAEAESAALPEDRVKSAKVFEISGVDLCGPLRLKDGTKVWVVLFTCAVYRCVHLELVVSLSTVDFLMALERFVRRRGRPSRIYADNGTNFRGADSLLKKLDWDKIQDATGVMRIDWRFIPPAAPWWGGWWERLFRSVKGMLCKMMGQGKLGYVNFETILCQVEDVINSRPLTVITEDQNDLVPLTPAMFLREMPGGEFPEAERLGASYDNLKQLRKELKMRFRKEYLGLLVQRGNEVKSDPIQVGDFVLIGADNLKRVMWPMGQVVELIPGRDGIQRVAKLRTARGNLVRPIQRLYPLEIRRQAEVPEPVKKDAVEVQDSGPTEIGRAGKEAAVEVKTRSGRLVKKPEFFKP